jgi:hypothetical protein
VVMMLVGRLLFVGIKHQSKGSSGFSLSSSIHSQRCNFNKDDGTGQETVE